MLIIPVKQIFESITDMLFFSLLEIYESSFNANYANPVVPEN